MDRYQFTNFTNEPFTGRYGGVDYLFAPSETKEFDPDKHYMLILMAKQLADRELLKGAKSVGRNPNDLEKFGKSLDESGNLYVITVDSRREIMKKAIGELLDKPIPIPEVETEEAGSTQKVSDNVRGLQEEMRELKDLVSTFVSKPKEEEPISPRNGVSEPSIIQTREALESIAKDKGIVGYETMSKERLVEAVAV